MLADKALGFNLTYPKCVTSMMYPGLLESSPTRNVTGAVPSSGSVDSIFMRLVSSHRPGANIGQVGNL